MQVFFYDAGAAVALWFLETQGELALTSFGTDKSAAATWVNGPTPWQRVSAHMPNSAAAVSSDC